MEAACLVGSQVLLGRQRRHLRVAVAQVGVGAAAVAKVQPRGRPGGGGAVHEDDVALGVGQVQVEPVVANRRVVHRVEVV